MISVQISLVSPSWSCDENSAGENTNFLGLRDLIMSGDQNIIFYSALAYKNIKRYGTSATMLRVCVCVFGGGVHLRTSDMDNPLLN
jgi:hypothetical protein